MEEGQIHRTPSIASFASDTTISQDTSLSLDSVPKTTVVQEPIPLPLKRHSRFFRHLRLSILTVYHRIFTTIFLANVIGLIFVLQHQVTLERLSTFASINFLVAILFRQDWMVNLIFRTAWLVPWTVPLRFRRIVARVYTYGGVHSGAAVAGTLWFLTFTYKTATQLLTLGVYAAPIRTTAYLITAALLIISILSLPPIRSRFHNYFEISHRYLGWTCILLFWVQLILLIDYTAQITNTTFPSSLIRSPTFWNLSALTILLLTPWLNLRRWTFTPYILSPHALRLHFTHKIHRFSCLSISTSPFGEYHPFATFPSTDMTEPGSSLIISAAGDWTKRQIHTAAHLLLLQSHVKLVGEGKNRETEMTMRGKMTFWIKGNPKAGVLSLSCIFTRVVIITTGSGIGPSLSSLLDRPRDQVARLVWSTRSPLQTYGKAICEEVRRVDPEAVVIDSDQEGRVDLVERGWRVFREVGAEAVFVLSNEMTTRRVVYGLESRGVPAFGPIWDS